MEIIKYNKQIKNIINIEIKDYIERHEKIELEIISNLSQSNKFINNPKNYESYLFK